MKIPSFLKVYGDLSYRGDCPLEDSALATFYNQIRKRYPETYDLIAFHTKNEGKRTMAMVQADKMKGLKPGVPDIVIPGSPTLLIELKRQDHTKSSWEPGQLAFLEQAHKCGAVTVLALGHLAALEAFEDWRKEIENRL